MAFLSLHLPGTERAYGAGEVAARKDPVYGVGLRGGFAGTATRFAGPAARSVGPATGSAGTATGICMPLKFSLFSELHPLIEHRVYACHRSFRSSS